MMNAIGKIVTTLRSVGQHPLHSGHPLSAATAFVWAQLRARAHPGEWVVGFPNHTKLAVKPWVKGAAHYIFPKLCEFEEMCLVMHLLRPGELFVDVGANIGAYTVLAAGVAHANVLAFEPSRRTFGQLERNMELNSLGGKVTAVNAALGGKSGVLQLSDNLGTENYILPHQTGGAEVPVLTLDSQTASVEPFLLKVDVEGYETEVFAGSVSLLAAQSLAGIIVERNDSGARYGFDEDLLHREIVGAGFKPFTYLPLERRLVPLSPDYRGNLIYLRDEQFAEDRLRSAPAFKLDGWRV